MPETKNINMSEEQIKTAQQLNIMDIASTDMTESQAEALESLAKAKAASVESVVGAPEMPTFRFRKPRPVVRDYEKIGRNDPCPCGSGLKYKKCCLDSGKYESTHTV